MAANKNTKKLRNVKIIILTRDVGCGYVASEVIKKRGAKFTRVYSTQRGGENARKRAHDAALNGYTEQVKPCNFIVASVHFTGSPIKALADAEFAAWAAQQKDL
jgi:hypothetical protein